MLRGFHDVVWLEIIRILTSLFLHFEYLVDNSILDVDADNDVDNTEPHIHEVQQLCLATIISLRRTFYIHNCNNAPSATSNNKGLCEDSHENPPAHGLATYFTDPLTCFPM